MSWMIAWPPIRKISVYRWPRMFSNRMSFASASSCGSLAESSFIGRTPLLSAGSDTFFLLCVFDPGPPPIVFGAASVRPFDRWALPFPPDDLWSGEVHAQDHEPFAVRRARKPVRFFLIPG